MNIQKKQESKNKSLNKMIQKMETVKEQETFFGRSRFKNLLEAEAIFDNSEVEAEINFEMF